MRSAPSCPAKQHARTPQISIGGERKSNDAPARNGKRTAPRTPRGRSFNQESNAIKRRAGTSINTHLGVPPYAQNMGIDEEQR